MKVPCRLMLLIVCLGMTTNAQERSLSHRLADTAGEVVIEAVKVGLDEAGTRLLGPTAWNGFKRVISPVMRRLQKRFPALSFGDPENRAARNASHEAALYLRNDSEMRTLLLDSFDKLGEGQVELLGGINRLERAVARASENIESLVDTSREILSEVAKLKPEVASATLPTNVDVSDFIEEVYLFARVRARREGRELDMRVFGTLLVIVATEQFKQRVLEDGLSFTYYRTTLGPYTVSMTARGKYKGPDGRLCRRYTIIQPDFVHDLKQRVSISGIYCRQEGSWRPIN